MRRDALSDYLCLPHRRHLDLNTLAVVDSGMAYCALQGISRPQPVSTVRLSTIQTFLAITQELLLLFDPT